ncbi:MAG: M48 family metalloprotease [Haliscomenobacter sp.]|nr:M48 family metalloprotease [Haliscomenobacter sp.]
MNSALLIPLFLRIPAGQEGFGLLPAPVVNALGWTVLHSLWQGALAALLLAFLLLALQRQKAQVRYAAAVVAQLTVLVAALTTFTIYFRWDAKTAVQIAGPQTMAQVQETLSRAVAETPWETWQQQFTLYFDRHLPLIVTLWLVGVLVFSLRLLGAWAYVRRLALVSIFPVEAPWAQRLQRLAERIRVSAPVALFESALVQAPLVIGHFKPVILVPLGLLSGLPPEQVEAILAHELAHIRRRDYLVNFLLSILETLFFFNPAIWWISAGIRREREYCCDEMAVSACSSALVYARALASLQERRPFTPVFAMAAAGKRKELLTRVQRVLLQQPINPSDVMEKTIATLLIVGSVLFFSMRATPPQSTAPTDPAAGIAKAAFLPADTLPPGRISIKSKTNGKSMEAKVEGRQIVELKVDGQEIPAEKYGEYENQVMELIEKLPPPPPPPPAPPAPRMAPHPAIPPIPPVPPVPGVPREGHSFFFRGAPRVDVEDMHIEIEDGDTVMIRREGPEFKHFFQLSDSLAAFPFGQNFEFRFEGLPDGFGEHAKELSFEVMPDMFGEHSKELAEKLKQMAEDAAGMAKRYRFNQQGFGWEEKDRQKLEEELRRIQEHQLQFQERFREDFDKELREYRFMPAPAPRARVEVPSWGQTPQQRIERSLLNDGLIDSKGGYRFELTDRTLKIDGQKQPDNIHRKYLKLYEQASGIDWDPKSRVVIEK